MLDSVYMLGLDLMPLLVGVCIFLLARHAWAFRRDTRWAYRLSRGSVRLKVIGLASWAGAWALGAVSWRLFETSDLGGLVLVLPLVYLGYALFAGSALALLVSLIVDLRGLGFSRRRKMAVAALALCFVAALYIRQDPYAIVSLVREPGDLPPGRYTMDEVVVVDAEMIDGQGVFTVELMSSPGRYRAYADASTRIRREEWAITLRDFMRDAKGDEEFFDTTSFVVGDDGLLTEIHQTL